MNPSVECIAINLIEGIIKAYSKGILHYSYYLVADRHIGLAHIVLVVQVCPFVSVQQCQPMKTLYCVGC